MAVRFRKSFKLAPGIRINLGKKSSSISFGSQGGRLTANTSGKITTSAGVPGSGITYSQSTGTPRKGGGVLGVIVAVIVVFAIGWIVYPKGSKQKPPPSPSTTPSTPAQSFSAAPVRDKLDMEQLEADARAYLEEDFALELTALRINSGSLEGTIAVPGVTDREDLSAKPEDWQDIQQRMVTAQVRLPEALEQTKYPAILLLKADDGTVLLSVKQGAIVYDEYREIPETPPGGNTSSPGSTTYVWVTSGGECYHTSSSCSGMSNPSMISLEEAIRRGYTACHTCG